MAILASYREEGAARRDRVETAEETALSETGSREELWS